MYGRPRSYVGQTLHLVYPIVEMCNVKLQISLKFLKFSSDLPAVLSIYVLFYLVLPVLVPFFTIFISFIKLHVCLLKVVLGLGVSFRCQWKW